MTLHRMMQTFFSPVTKISVALTDKKDHTTKTDDADDDDANDGVSYDADLFQSSDQIVVSPNRQEGPYHQGQFFQRFNCGHCRMHSCSWQQKSTQDPLGEQYQSPSRHLN